MPALTFLEFTEALKDSPSFRRDLAQHEYFVNILDTKVKQVIKQCNAMIETGKAFVDSFGLMLVGLKDLSECCFDGEPTVQNGFKIVNGVFEEVLTFQKVLTEQAQWTIIKSLNEFVRREVNKTREVRTHFEKVSASLDEALTKNAQCPRSKLQDSCEIKNELTAVGTCFAHTALDYIFHLNLVQSHRKHDLLEPFLSFLRAIQTYFHQGHDLFESDVYKTQNDQLIELVNELKTKSRQCEKKMQDRHILVPKEIFQHSPGMPLGADVVMEGYLYKRASKTFKTFKRRWFCIRNNELLYRKREWDLNHNDLMNGGKNENVEEFFAKHFSPLADLRICLVRRPTNAHMDRQHCFELVTPSKNHLLQADSEPLAETWIKALQRSIESALHDNAAMPSVLRSDSPSRMSAGSVDSENFDSSSSLVVGQRSKGPSGGSIRPSAKIAEQILPMPGNSECADCGAANPQWASINLGVTLCIDCCGVHRSLSVQISKVRSLVLDAWDPEQIQVMLALGNEKINGIYLRYLEANPVPPAAKPTSNQAVRNAWIRAKYVEKRFSRPHSIGLENGEHSAKGQAKNEIRPLVVNNEKVEKTASFGSQTLRIPVKLVGQSSAPMNPLLAAPKSRAFSSSSPDLLDVDAIEANLNSSHFGSDSNLVAAATAEAPGGAGSEAEIHQRNLALFGAAQAANVFGMAEALAQGAVVNFMNEEAALRTSLFETVALGSLEATEFLLLNGAKVNVQDVNAMTPLHVACENGFTAHVCQLLKRGASQDVTDVNGRTPLDVAMERADADIVTLLRLAKLNQEIKDSSDSGYLDDQTFIEVVRDFSQIRNNPSVKSSPELIEKKLPNGSGND